MVNPMIPTSGPATSGTPHLGGRNYDYTHRYSPDEPGKEVDENARVWNVYLDEAGDYDMDMIKGFQDIIDSLLVFASLFSAVVTTFVAQTSQALQPDNLQIMVSLLIENNQLLRAAGNKTSINAVPAASLGSESQTSTLIDVWVNGLFFTSLALSISTALLSVLAKQWIQAYTAIVSGSAKTHAMTRHFRFQGLEKYKLGDFVKSLPLILHCSVAIFLVGLALYVSQLSHSICVVVAGITALTFLIYFGSTMIPALDIACPYRISFMFYLAQILCFAFNNMQHAYLYLWNALKPLFDFAYSYHIFFVSHIAQLQFFTLVTNAYKHFWKVFTQVLLSIWKLQIPKKSIKVVEQNHILKNYNNSCLVQPSLDWLFNHSSNASVKDIIIEATCGLCKMGYSDSSFSANLYISILKYSSSRLFFLKEGTLYVQFIGCITQLLSLEELESFSTLKDCKEEIMLAVVEFYENALQNENHTLSHKLVDWVKPTLCKSGNKWSPKFLHKCAMFGNAENVNYLINQEIDLDGLEFSGWTPLHTAARHGHLNMVIFLVERKPALMSAVTNVTSSGLGWTALDGAIKRCHFNIAGYLLNHGARSSSYALYAAISNFGFFEPDLEKVRLLLDHGWDRTLRDTEGKTLLDIARSNNKTKLVNLLENYQTVRICPYEKASQEASEPQFSASIDYSDSSWDSAEEENLFATEPTH